ncbi:hypothetical protein PRIC1_006834 [Phytophthora ramorum]
MQPHFEHVIGGCSRFEIKTHLLAPSLGRLEVEAEDTVLPLSVHPFLTCNLNMEGTQTLSARALLGLPLLACRYWTAATGTAATGTAVGAQADLRVARPLLPAPRSFRLRSAMVLGWAVSSTALIAIFFRDQPTPYFQDRKLVGTPLVEVKSQRSR